MSKIEDMIGETYNALEGSEVAEAYSRRHGVDSLAILTVYDDETAALIAERLAPRIAGKNIVEIGGGIGLLAFHLADHAKSVMCVEAEPAWSSAFLACLYAQKPKNVSYIFGIAQELIGRMSFDVAVFCTHSDALGMKKIGTQLAGEVIDVYGEIIRSDPEKFDPIARELRAAKARQR